MAYENPLNYNIVTTMLKSSESYHLDLQKKQQDEIILDLSGHVNNDNAGPFLETVQSLVLAHKPKKVKLNMANLSYMDSSGAAALVQARLQLETKRIDFIIENPPKAVESLFDLLALDQLPRTEHPKSIGLPGPISRIGENAISLFQDIVFQIVFLGEIILALGQALLHPGKIRWNNMLLTMERVGVDAFPIVSLITFLVGFTIGLQSAVSLRQFGANIYLADLVGLGMVRELGPLMTAILVAGRSGSAFAAEIGTMKVSEEVDALTTMGFDPLRFLAVPKILAVLVVVPCLALFADMMGILGGMAVGVGWLDLTFYGYIIETKNALSVTHVFSGIFKSIFFGLAIAVIGCLRGFQVQGGAESVGRKTTSSVVTAIFTIIVLDAIFGSLFQAWGI